MSATPFRPVSGLLAALDLLRIGQRDAIVHIRLNRPVKRTAITDALVAQLHTAFVNLPETARVVVLSGEREHFRAGLDLSELGEHSVAEGIEHSRSWHAAFEQIHFARVPVIAVLHGAVVGGGLELASAAHIRVAEASTFCGPPEGQRGALDAGGAVLAEPPVREFFQKLVDNLHASGTGSAARVARALVLTEPPRIDREINTRFIKSATYGETLTITTHVEEWRSKVVVQMHRITRARADGGEDLICEGREVRAFVKRDDTDRDRLRAIPVPEDIRLLCS